jgi:CheY-like chemotaxis protein
MDIALAGMDGIELCRTRRADARTRDIPVLAITGHGDRHDPDRVRSAGADRLLAKPCDVDVLLVEALRLIGHADASAGG